MFFGFLVVFRVLWRGGGCLVIGLVFIGGLGIVGFYSGFFCKLWFSLEGMGLGMVFYVLG